METLLLIEDDAKIADFIVKYAKNENFGIVHVTDGKAGLLEAINNKYDLIILDIMLPKMSGLDVCREIRKNSNIPIIFLSARADEIDRVLGLEIGADDYVTKPFSPRELLARVKAVLRRTADKNSSADSSKDNQGQPKILTYKNLTLDTLKHEVKADGKLINLTYTQFEILKKLMSSPGRVFSREDLYVAIWGAEAEGMSRTVDVHIKYLREAIKNSIPDSNYIISIRGVGYKLDEENEA
ncbi:MAG: response regulator transcription factor [Candidatus Wallbacteria bacterium]